MQTILQPSSCLDVLDTLHIAFCALTEKNSMHEFRDRYLLPARLQETGNVQQHIAHLRFERRQTHSAKHADPWL